MINHLFQGSAFKLDPTLITLKSGTAFQYTKDSDIIIIEKNQFSMNNLKGQITEYWCQNKDDNYRVIDDDPSGVIFIYKLMSEDNKSDTGLSIFMNNPLEVELDGQDLSYVPYSEVFNYTSGDNKGMARIWQREIGEQESEYLWAELFNNKTLRYFIGLDIHSTQII